MDLPVTLRKGKAKTILESSRDSALLAVEIYNKPRTAFRSEGYISLMVIAWTKLFHAIFHCTMGDNISTKRKMAGMISLMENEKLGSLVLV